MSGLENQNLSSSPPPSSSIDELCVFLMNRIGICVSASEAATTQELVNKVIETWFTPRSSTSTIKSSINQLESSTTSSSNTPKIKSPSPPTRVTNRYPTKGRDDLVKFFTLWITSPTLELQLKPLHRPFKVLKHWENLSSKYGYTKDRYFNHNGAINSSVNCEPIVSFQRNIFTQKWEEMNTTDPDVLQLLYEEAKVNILDGRYPVDTFEQLAAIQTAIEIGPFNPKLHTSKYLKSLIGQMFGHHHRSLAPSSSTKWTTINTITSTFTQSSSSLESKIIHYYRRLGATINKIQLYRNYLQLCWPLPYYGSAYFHGLIERSTKNLISLISNRLVQVWIAINPIGVHIIDEKHSRLIITLDFSKFKWELALTTNEQSINQSNQPTELPSIFFYFWSRNDYKPNLIRVISPQAYLMNTLLNAFNENKSGQLTYRQLYTKDNDLNFNFDHQKSKENQSTQKTKSVTINTRNNYKGNLKHQQSK